MQRFGGAGGARTRDQRIIRQLILAVLNPPGYPLSPNDFHSSNTLLHPADSQRFAVIIGD
jgi:hypothetical protein